MVIASAPPISPAEQGAIIGFIESYSPGSTSVFVANGGKIGVGPIKGSALGTNDGTNIIIEPGRGELASIASIFHELIHTKGGSPGGGLTACQHAVAYSVHFSFLEDLLEFGVWSVDDDDDDDDDDDGGGGG